MRYICSATLSTISTGLNAGATILFKTILKDRFEIKDENRILYMRIFIVLFGCLIMFGATIFANLPGSVIGMSRLIGGYEF